MDIDSRVHGYAIQGTWVCNPGYTDNINSGVQKLKNTHTMIYHHIIDRQYLGKISLPKLHQKIANIHRILPLRAQYHHAALVCGNGVIITVNTLLRKIRKKKKKEKKKKKRGH